MTDPESGALRTEHTERQDESRPEARVPIRVLICDDAGAYAALVAHWIDDSDDLEVCGHASSARDALDLAGRCQPDVVVLDHRLGPTTSEELVPKLRRAAPGAAIVLISGMPADELKRLARVCGADRSVAKSAHEWVLLETLRRSVS